jgi:hypothetical protein
VGANWRQLVKYWRKAQNRPAGMAFAKNPPDEASLSPLDSEFFLVLPQKRVISTQEGWHLCLVQERKAENEECL